jgi:hypothetical protein
MKRIGIWTCALIFIGLTTAGCPGSTGTTVTTYGPRPTAEVVAQDTVADILKNLEDGYKAAVVAHDARFGTEDPVKHAANRALLIKEHDALIAAANALVAWKQAAGSSYSPASVIQPLIDSLPDYVKLAVDLGALTQVQGDKILAYAKTLFPTKLTGSYLWNFPNRDIVPVWRTITADDVPVSHDNMLGGTVIAPQTGITWGSLVTTETYRAPRHPKAGEAYSDGCNTHTYLGGGLWSSTAMWCPPAEDTVIVPESWTRVPTLSGTPIVDGGTLTFGMDGKVTR